MRFGTEHAGGDLEQNVIGTQKVLEAMRLTGVLRIAFSSTGSVYGEATFVPTPEDAPFPEQHSLYGASKLAAESLIAAYCEGSGFQGTTFRSVSILGDRYTHGHVFDFCKMLPTDPTKLRRAAAEAVSPCRRLLSAMLSAIVRPDDKFAVFKLGTDEYLRGARLGRLDICATRCLARIELHRW